MVDGTALGDFLKARRGRLGPADVGLNAGSRRRVPGLRREEVAALAGISADYYLRIEQGRVEAPSAQVLNALARALQLDGASSYHLHALAASSTVAPSDPADRLDDGTALLLDQLAVPAFVASRYLDCLASNALARALSPSFSPGRNLLRQIFLDPAERRLHLDWDETAASVVGGLRFAAGTRTADRRLAAMVTALTDESEEFGVLWSGAPVGYRPSGDSHLLHPLVGELHLRRHRFDIPDSGGQHLHVYHAEPGSESEERLGRLRAGGEAG